MRVRLTLIAHAATDAMRAGRFSAGEGIDTSGRAATLAARNTIAPVGAAALTGPDAAARETAGALGLAGSVDEGLRDLDLGRWRGRTLVDVARIEPSAGAFAEDPAYDAHDGESIDALCGRIAAWLDRRIGVAGPAFAVAAPAVLRAAIVGVLDAPASAFWNIEIEPLTRLYLGADDRRWSLRGLGRPATLGDETTR